MSEDGGSSAKEPENSSAALFGRFRSKEGGEETLKSLGLMDEVRNSPVTSSVLGRFRDQVWQGASKVARERGAGSFELNASFRNSYDFRPVRWALGTATLSGSFKGWVDVQPDGAFRYSGNGIIGFYDRFHDPYDVGNMFEGEWNAGGVPYNISGSWIQVMEGRGP